MSAEHIHRNDKGHVLAEKSESVERRQLDGIIVPAEPEIRVAKPHGDFRVVKVGETAPHDIGCNCSACVQRRRVQARQPEFAAIVEARAAKLPPPQAQALRKAFGLET